MVDSENRSKDRAVPPAPGGRRGLERTVLLAILALAVVAAVSWTALRVTGGTASSHPGATASPATPAPSTPAPTTSPSASTKDGAGRSSAKPTSTPKPSTVAVSIPKKGPGTYTVASVGEKAAGSKGRLITFDVRVEKGLPYSANEVARTIATTLNDKRSWRGDGTVRFKLVPGGKHADLHAYLATPDTVDKLCAPLGTHGDLSCRNGAKIALNADRWAFAEPWFHGDVVTYREYLVNHEFGHAIGYEHKQCPGKGKRAPVMMQQTKGLHGCLPNPWPYPNR